MAEFQFANEIPYSQLILQLHPRIATHQNWAKIWDVLGGWEQ